MVRAIQEFVERGKSLCEKEKKCETEIWFICN